MRWGSGAGTTAVARPGASARCPTQSGRSGPLRAGTGSGQLRLGPEHLQPAHLLRLEELAQPALVVLGQRQRGFGGAELRAQEVPFQHQDLAAVLHPGALVLPDRLDHAGLLRADVGAAERAKRAGHRQRLLQRGGLHRQRADVHRRLGALVARRAAGLPASGGHCGRRGLQVDLRAVRPEQLGAAMVYVTGSKAHNIKLRQRAIERGWILNEYSLSDSETGEVRDSTLADLNAMARLADALPNLHMFQRTVVARDIADTHEMDLNTAYACAAGTGKPIGTSFSAAETMRDAIAMFHMIAGGEAAWRARPFGCVSTCFIVPPLTIAEEALAIIECAADTGTSLKLVSAG